jgi:hypothetical protein
MTTDKIIEKTRLATERFIYLIKEKGEDDILNKSFYFNAFLAELMEINDSLIDIEKDEILGYLSNK